MRSLENITIVNFGDDEWMRERQTRFRIIQTSDYRWRRGIFRKRAEDYMGPETNIRDRLTEIAANLSAFIGGMALSKQMYYSVIRLMELTR